MGEVDEDGGDGGEVEKGILNGRAVHVGLGVCDGRVEESKDGVSLLLAEELAVESKERASEVVFVHKGLDDGLESGAEGSGEEKTRSLFELEILLMPSLVSAFSGSGEGKGRDVDIEALGNVLELGKGVGG